MSEGSTPTQSATDAAPPLSSAVPRNVWQDAPRPQSNWKLAAKWLYEQACKRGPQVWKLCRDVARYYWGIREPLREFMHGFAPELRSESVRQREVQLLPDESHPLAEFGPEGWKLAIPGRCVVCGEPCTAPPTEETLAVDDASRAFWTPASIMIFGATVGWFLLGRWIAVLSIPLGFVIGYYLRTRIPVRMRVVRCDTHVRLTRIPRVLAWGDTLVVRFGHKTVRQVFRHGEHAGPAAPTSTGLEQPAGPPMTVHLADSPHPDDAVIRHEVGRMHDTEK
jgi:hypothetical protein